jgi:hypothetical protein
MPDICISIIVVVGVALMFLAAYGVSNATRARYNRHNSD